MRKSINLNFEVKNLDDTKIETAGKILASSLMTAIVGDPLKFYDWAQDLNQQKELILDESDIKTLYDFVKDHKELFVVAKAPIMKAINNAKEYKKTD